MHLPGPVKGIQFSNVRNQSKGLRLTSSEASSSSESFDDDDLFGFFACVFFPSPVTRFFLLNE